MNWLFPLGNWTWWQFSVAHSTWHVFGGNTMRRQHFPSDNAPYACSLKMVNARFLIQKYILRDTLYPCIRTSDDVGGLNRAKIGGTPAAQHRIVHRRSDFSTRQGAKENAAADSSGRYMLLCQHAGAAGKLACQLACQGRVVEQRNVNYPNVRKYKTPFLRCGALVNGIKQHHSSMFRSHPSDGAIGWKDSSMSPYFGTLEVPY